MLFLLKQEEGDSLLYLFKDKEYVIGRKNADIEFGDDQSISRRHSLINTKGNTITLRDCGSKYGTHHNTAQLKANVDVTLNNNDLIKFGMFKNKYRLQKISIVTTSTSLSPEDKAEIKKNLDHLGGTIVNHWDDSSTHLTTNAIILTLKVLHALVDKRPIVTSQYWSQFVTHTKDRKMPPNTKDFKPPITENLINTADFPEDVDRTRLFSDKIFVFVYEKTRRKMIDLIRKTGGSSISWQKEQVSLLEVTRSKNYIFIYEDSTSESQKFNNDAPKELQDIWKHLEKLGERTIPLQEIAMAIVQNSCEKDCNPKFNRIHNVFNLISPDTETGAISLAQNTPSEYGFDVNVTKREVVIPESLEAECEMPPPRVTQTTKRTLSLDKNLSSTSKEVDGVTNRTRTPLSVSNVFAVPKAIPSTSRQALDNPPKRIRLEDPVVPATGNKEKTSQNVQSNVCVASGSKKSSGDPSLLRTTTELEPRKRKAEEITSFVRKRTEKANPFALLKRQKTNPANPLQVKEEAEDEDNPFLQIMKRRTTHTLVARVEEKIEESFQNSQIYESPSYVASSGLDVAWMSTINVRSPLEVVCKLEQDVDPEFQEIFERFKDSVVIETMPASFVRVATPLCTTVLSNSSVESKNFKKFQKVQPRHPQSTILVTSFEELPLPEDVPLQSDGEDAGDDEMPQVSTAARKPMRKPLTFVF